MVHAEGAVVKESNGQKSNACATIRQFRKTRVLGFG